MDAQPCIHEPSKSELSLNLKRFGVRGVFMSDHEEQRRPRKRPQAQDADKSVAEAKPDEVRMSGIAKRLFATPPAKRKAQKPC